MGLDRRHNSRGFYSENAQNRQDDAAAAAVSALAARASEALLAGIIVPKQRLPQIKGMIECHKVGVSLSLPLSLSPYICYLPVQ